MWVHPKQLIPGCVINRDVMGKTNRPIMPKNTVLTEEYIDILDKFLIERVDVSPNLSYGDPFVPKDMPKEESNKDEDQSISEKKPYQSFQDQYLEAVQSYKKLFTDWQSGASIDMSQVRNVAVPLLERIDEVGLDLFLLHKLSTKQDYFYNHSLAMCLISAFLAKKKGLKKEWIQVGLAGILADSGMAKINRLLFHRQGKLSDPEYEEIKKHPTFSYRLVEKIPSLSVAVKLAILQHHERPDGSGYPLGVQKNKIHPYASILSISDTYHAMTSERIYQSRQSPFKVIEEMMSDQFNKFDHELLELFVESLTNFSTGTRVKLSNNKQAEIVFIESKYPTRPMVRMDDDNQTIISLKDDKSIYIEEILSENR
ncbi:HD-GYP domain-containing protein [Aquibacillus albus]|uniref:HD-GYP domain-containing protein (C-di-GMP phosphodiesterase class II) n=1 Tax=Aquibacillus albus TaxID=1168171 RepID=A0ABS2N315_9BACI|nr:HD-GYP domain-containing protein [Aquibacillus albus]MBM7572509.1 HD-GYP domain-containing protein (c-di-GMP phosphodiesterase class II) [Aquibacillus albus]